MTIKRLLRNLRDVWLVTRVRQLGFCPVHETSLVGRYKRCPTCEDERMERRMALEHADEQRRERIARKYVNRLKEDL